MVSSACASSGSSTTTPAAPGTTMAMGAASPTSMGSVGAPRPVAITMVDIGYQPSTPLTFPRGTTVEFTFHNTGKVAHEATIGNAAAQSAHERDMSSMQPGGVVMNEPGQIDVAPGQTKTLTYTFTDAGMLFIGCHYPSHYAAGMKIPITVT
ncbi:MAG: cupredoxin domain-containing protein [Acidimicrobiales bacterium]